MRILYTVISVVLIFAGYILHKTILTDSATLNLFSYIGTLATLIALLVTICETIISIKKTESVQQEVKNVLEKINTIEKTSSISDCLTLIDETNKFVMSEDYDRALQSFQFFRKICTKTSLELKENSENEKPNTINNLEHTLQKATATTTRAGLNKKQKTDILNALLDIKTTLESNNPAKRN